MSIVQLGIRAGVAALFTNVYFVTSLFIGILMLDAMYLERVRL